MRSWFGVVLLAVGVVASVGSASIQQAQQDHINRLCGDPQYAYEDGYNAAMKRKPMNTAWIEQSCLPESRATARQSWVNGYQAGAARAPVVMVGNASGPPPVVQCRFTSDCGGEGYSCRPWQGTNVCMGYGSAGAPCWFSGDCLSGRCDLNRKMCN